MQTEGVYAPKSPDLSDDEQQNDGNHQVNQQGNNSGNIGLLAAYQPNQAYTFGQANQEQTASGYAPRSPRFDEQPQPQSLREQRSSIGSATSGYQIPLSHHQQTPGYGPVPTSTYSEPAPPVRKQSSYVPPTPSAQYPPHTTGYPQPQFTSPSYSAYQPPAQSPYLPPTQGSYFPTPNQGYSPGGRYQPPVQGQGTHGPQIPQQQLTYGAPHPPSQSTYQPPGTQHPSLQQSYTFPLSTYSAPNTANAGHPHLKAELTDPSIASIPTSSLHPSQSYPSHAAHPPHTANMAPSVKQEPLAQSSTNAAALALGLTGSGPSLGIEVRTKFPVARIKRIMQADEEVGKVAQVTPVAVSKALELFMISLVTKSAAIAKNSSSKRVTASHLKKAIEADEQFDFLNDIVAKIPDVPESNAAKEGRRKREKTEDTEEKSESGSEAEEKPKRKGRRKKAD